MLGTLERELSLRLALGALETQDYLLGGLRLSVEDRTGLTTITTLLAVVPPLTLSIQRCLTSLVLGHLVRSVAATVLAFAKGVTRLRDVNHWCW